MSRRALAMVVAGLGAVAACGGSGTSSPTSAPVTSGSVAATQPSTAASTAPASTEAWTGPVYPLTGLPATDATAAARPALVVKIDNNERARPQSGLNEADIVFEEIVEVQTRFAAVFHSGGADPVGPIRSGRTQDIDLLGSFLRPLFVWSGGNDAVTDAIEDSDLIELSGLRQSIYDTVGFYRDDARPAPHDLFATTSGAWLLAPDDAVPPPPQFRFRPAGTAAVGNPATRIEGTMEGLAIEWTYDASTGRYWRTNGGVAHEDALSGPISTNNVIVMVVQYRPSPADNRSPEAQTIGSGEVFVFTGGVLIRGIWSRSDRLSPIQLLADDGSPILLTPGRTWVELAKASTFSAVS
ncbi:MAG: DUF3048 domain-containing protein [Ilumatobacteraceae bacterium]